MQRRRVIILGAAGRDFHNFNIFFRSKKIYEVIAFTGTQIPDIEKRTYPKELSGDLYPEGIPIYPEAMLADLIKDFNVEIVVFSYSDVSHEEVMHKASISLAAGADFMLLGPRSTMLKSRKKVIAICAVRTGSGKSQTTRKVCEILKDLSKKYNVVRHPMPYGDLLKQSVQKFEKMEDLDLHNCTIEEREEYEPHIKMGTKVFAGVDYKAILKEAEKGVDVVVWDGGNNDLPFFNPDVMIVVVDPHRTGHELKYHPGETNLRMASVVVINKVDSAERENIDKLKANIRTANKHAAIIEARSPITVDNPEIIKGKRVLVIEDGPTLTHGGMSFGAGFIAAKKFRAKELIDPRPFAVGSIKSIFEKYPQTSNVLPAIGYSATQLKELSSTIKSSNPEVVLIASPVDLRKLIEFEVPAVRVYYELEEKRGPKLCELIENLLF